MARQREEEIKRAGGKEDSQDNSNNNGDANAKSLDKIYDEIKKLKESVKKSRLDKKRKNKLDHDEDAAEKKRQALELKKPTQYSIMEEGFTSIKVHCHWGWVTQIKYYEDLNYLITSSLDSFIHMHELETLNYRTKKTFNLHLKGINSFVYSVKHK